MKFFVYARKSIENEDRQIASIESQIKELKEIALRESLEIVDIIYESKSAKAPGREKFNEMLNRIYNHEAEGILCWKLDRLARNFADGGMIIQLLQTNVIHHIRTYEKNYYPSDNVLLMSFEFGIANQFILDLKAHTARGMRDKADRGWFPVAHPPLGYLHNPKKQKGIDEIIIDENNFFILQKVFKEIIKQEFTPRQIFNKANNEWGLRSSAGGKVAQSTFYRLLENKFFYGEFEYPTGSGNWRIGKHKHLITKQEYESIQKILNRKNKILTPYKHNFTFKNAIYCILCHSSITGEKHIKTQKNGNVHEYIHYRYTRKKDQNCTNKKSITEKDLNIQMIDILESIEIPKSFVSWAIGVLKDENEKKFENHAQIIQSQRKGYDNTVQKLKRLTEMKLNDDLLDEEYKLRRSELLTDKKQFEEIINDTNLNIENWVEKAEILFNYANTAKQMFEKGNLQDKQNVIRSLGSNLYLDNGKLTVILSKPFDFIQKKSVAINQMSSTLEPVKDKDYSIDYRGYECISKQWGHLLDLFMNRQIEFNINMSNVKKLIGASFKLDEFVNIL